MENPYIEYYSKQAGSGISGYAGNRYHVGNGFFGKILKNLKPALRYIGKQGWDAIKSISSDVMGGDSLKEAGKKTLIRTAKNVMNDASEKLEEYKKRKQTGSGKKKVKKVYKRKTVKRKTKSPVKKKKPVKKKSKKLVKKVYKKRKTTKKANIVSSFF